MQNGVLDLWGKKYAEIIGIENVRLSQFGDDFGIGISDQSISKVFFLLF